MSYSVLMSVYRKEKAPLLREAMQSIFNQTLPTDDFVVVCDGELTDELYKVLNDFKTQYGNILNIVGYKENKGLGYALAFGLEKCKNNIVIRMDSDDISYPNRAEIQVSNFVKDGVDLSSCYIDIFEGKPSNVIGLRKIPTNNEDILKFSKMYSPFNHLTAIYKKDAVLAAGNYQTLLYKEDYYLWIRMIENGCKFNNRSDVLAGARIDSNTFKRRKSKVAYNSSKWLAKYLYRIHYINWLEYIKCRLFNFVRKALPVKLGEKITRKHWLKEIKQVKK